MSLPIGWQFWIAMEAEGCYQLYYPTFHHFHQTQSGISKAQTGIRDASGTFLPIGWKRGSEHSRARFWTRWTRDRADARVGLKRTRWSRRRGYQGGSLW